MQRNSPALRGRGCEFLLGNGVVIEQDVSVRLQRVSMLSLGEGSRGPYGQVCPISQVPRASVPSGHFCYRNSKGA